MFVSLDLETTGVDPKKDKIIELGAVKFDLKNQKETLQFFINPGITLPQLITHITGITDKDLQDAPPFDKKADEIKKFIGDLPIVGHNIKFDTDFLKENNIEIKNPEYDTFEFAGILLPNLPSYSLEILSHTLDLRHKEKHRALGDAIASAELFLKLTEEFEKLDPELIKKIHQLCEKTSWPLKDFILTLKSSPGAKISLQLVPGHYKENNSKIPQLPEKSALIEFPPPYENFVKSLVEKIDEGTHIALPHQLFNEMQTQAKIDSPKKYISPRRLEEFEQKPTFENHEFTALLKYLIWIKQTKTGLLTEVSLFHQEKQTIPYINVDENFTDIKEEPFFQKALPVICSHEYLIEQKPKIKDLILFDIDKFIKNLFFHESEYLKLDILQNQLNTLREFAPKNKTIESLISKSTILFGFIGLIFEKYNDKSPYVPRATIMHLETQTKEWKDVNTTIANLIEISLELAEIHTPQTHGHLQNWKNSLQALTDIFKEPDLENNMVWVEKDYLENVIVRKAPFSLKEALHEILKNCENYKIISENLDLDDNGEFIKTLLNLPQDLKVHNETQKNKNLKIMIIEDTAQEKAEKLIPYLKEKKGKTAIIFNSKQQLQYFTLKLAEPLKEAGIKIASQMTGALGKITEQFKQDPENSILFITPNFWENFKNHELIDNLIIQKLPFDPPSDPYILTTEKSFRNAFMEFQIPRAVFALKKIINRLNSYSKKEVIILDSRIVTKDYGKAFLKALKNLVVTEVTNLAI